jgi:hypothetical protein
MAAVAHEVSDFSIPRATLPVSTADGPTLVSEAGVKFGERFSAAYNAAQPFPHIVLDDFLPRELPEWGPPYLRSCANAETTRRLTALVAFPHLQISLLQVAAKSLHVEQPGYASGADALAQLL